MPRNANVRRIYALSDYTVKRTGKGWYFGRTSRFGDLHGLKGPYSSERSVALMIARELIKEIVQRDTQTKLPRVTGEFLYKKHTFNNTLSLRVAIRGVFCRSPRLVRSPSSHLRGIGDINSQHSSSELRCCRAW